MIDSLAVNDIAYSLTSFWGGLTIAALLVTLKRCEQQSGTLKNAYFFLGTKHFVLGGDSKSRSGNNTLNSGESFHKSSVPNFVHS